ncbi:SGNH/GDSL hydrolase family protein [Massilia jejuensis]|uniref:SGNH/GDSL hydrolase family protein n=1 Tax=Massilia jejuensis TaxID=648894 RepID=A0ABW0PC60_9BURK
MTKLRFAAPVPDAGPRRRSFLTAGPLLAASLAVPALPAHAQTGGAGWCATWGAAPAGPPPSGSVQTYAGQTLRLLVRSSIGGSRLRIRVSNEMGSTPLRIGRASIALRASGAAVIQASLRGLRFGGAESVTIPARAPAVSDPLDLDLPAQADLAISLYLAGSVQGSTLHNAALQGSYVSPGGDYTSTVSMPVARTLASWPFLTGVDVSVAAPCLVVLGDSLTDGQGSTSNANRRWPDYLARRLPSALGAAGRIGVVNRGISGNSMLTDYPNALLAGHAALARFDRDVLATSGVRHLIALIGINDICYSPGSNPIPVEELIAGYRQLIARAQARDITIIGATLPPFEGFSYYTAARERVRRAVNDWMRAGAEFDALLDTEAALRDPARPSRLLPVYDSGDHLHPNDAGYQAVADAVPLAPFVPNPVLAGERTGWPGLLAGRGTGA